MDQPGLNGRHRKRNGEIARKHGNTEIGVLREVYGDQFAAGCEPREKLVDVLHKLDEPSLTKLVHDVHGFD